MKDHWEFYRQQQAQRNMQQAAGASPSGASTGGITTYSLGRSKPYTYTKKELEELQKASEQKAEAGNMEEIYRCIAYYEYKGDGLRTQYWMEKACNLGDGYSCLELAKKSSYSPGPYYMWLNKAYNAGVREVFDQIVYYTANHVDPEKAIQMMETRAVSEPKYYYQAASERFKRGTLTYDSLKGIALLKTGAMKGDSSCRFWLEALSNPKTAKIAAISLGMNIMEENVNGNWIIARHFRDSYSLPDSFKQKFTFKGDIIYAIDGKPRYESRGSLFSISSTLFVESYKTIIKSDGTTLRDTDYEKIDRPVAGYVPFRKKGYQGFMDTMGVEVVPAEHFFATIGQDGNIIVSDGVTAKTRRGMQEISTVPLTWEFQSNINAYGGNHIINKQVPEFKLDFVKTIYQYEHNKTLKTDQYLVTPKGDLSGWEPGKPLGIIDKNAKWVVPLVNIPASPYYMSYNKYFVFEKGGKLGVYSDDGSLWLDAQFDYVGTYDSFAKAFTVYNNDKMGLYRIGGEKILECDYYKIERTLKTIKGKRHLGWSYENNKVRGFINEKGKVLFEEKKF